jgi:hypothetical protein
MYEFQTMHNKILEDLSKLDKCSNFILTERQLQFALDTNQKIIKPYIGFANNKKEFINIREFVIDKLTKYNIIGVKFGKYNTYSGTVTHPGGRGNSYTDNDFYIVFINIHGEIYGNIFLEHRYQEEHNSLTNGQKFIPHDLYLELFIKPFAIKPLLDRFGTFVDGLHWAPYIDRDSNFCKPFIDGKGTLINRNEEPIYKEYIASDKIIPESVIFELNYNLEIQTVNLYNIYYTKYQDQEYLKKNLEEIFCYLKKEITKNLEEIKQNNSQNTKQNNSQNTKQNNSQNTKQNNIKILYHQTDLDSASKIKKTQKMLRGKTGIVGPGIYFADNPNDTCHKAKKGGVILKASVDLGVSLNVHKKDIKPYTYMELLNLGYNSIYVYGMSGNEYIVYSWHQVKNIDVYIPIHVN